MNPKPVRAKYHLIRKGFCRNNEEYTTAQDAISKHTLYI